MSASTTDVDDAKTVTTTVRGVTLRLAAHTRALELCVWMPTAYAVKRADRISARAIPGSHLEAEDLI